MSLRENKLVSHNCIIPSINYIPLKPIVCDSMRFCMRSMQIVLWQQSYSYNYSVIVWQDQTTTSLICRLKLAQLIVTNSYKHAALYTA